jgi:hypothetical protein
LPPAQVTLIATHLQLPPSLNHGSCSLVSVCFPILRFNIASVYILTLTALFTSERTLEQIQAELHFVNYLSENGVNVSKPVPSQNGNLVETIQAAGIPFHIVTWVHL